MQHLIESGTDIETLAKKKVDKERGLISMEDAVEEVIADSCADDGKRKPRSVCTDQGMAC